MDDARHTAELGMASEAMDPLRRAGLVMMVADAQCVRGDFAGAGDSLEEALWLVAEGLRARFGDRAAHQAVLRLLREPERMWGAAGGSRG